MCGEGLLYTCPSIHVIFIFFIEFHRNHSGWSIGSKIIVNGDNDINMLDTTLDSFEKREILLDCILLLIRLTI